MNITLINGYSSKSSNFYLFIDSLLLSNLPLRSVAQNAYANDVIASSDHIIKNRMLCWY
jgi:hypothetical protein